MPFRDLALARLDLACDLTAAIVSHPLMVTPQTPLQGAITQMSEERSRPIPAEPTRERLPSPSDQLARETRSGCVLVVESGQILGILTDRDVVGLCAQGVSLETPIQAVMTTPVWTIRAADLQDLGRVETFFNQYLLRYLPIVAEDGSIVGLLTRESLQWRLSPSRIADMARVLGQAERRMASLAAAVPVGMFQTDAAGNCLSVNDRWCQIAGLTPQESVGQGWVKSLYPDDRALVVRAWNAAVQAQRPFQLEYRYQRGDGQITWVYGQAVAEYGEVGQIVGYVGTITDITDCKATEQALQIQRDFNQRIAEITSRFIDVSPSNLAAEIDRALELIGEASHVDTSYLIQFSESNGDPTCLDDRTLTMTHEWCRPGVPRQIAQVQHLPLSIFPWSNARLLQREVIHIPDTDRAPRAAEIDRTHWQQFHLKSILVVPLVQNSVVTGVLGFASLGEVRTWSDEMIRLLTVVGQAIADVQERVQIEQHRLVSEERLRLALRAANQGLYDLNCQTGEVVVSPEYALMLGYDPATFRETNARWLDRLHADDRARVSACFNAYIAGTLPEYSVEFRLRTAAGDYKWILSLGKIVAWDADGQPLRMLGTHTDITDRKQAEAEQLRVEKIHQELKLLELILETLLAGYWDWHIPSQYDYLSPGFKRMLGYDDHELPNGQGIWQQLIFPDDLTRVMESFDRHVQSQGQVPHSNEVRYRCKDGSTIWVICSGQVIEWDAAGQPIRMIGCHVDITQRKRAEEKLRKQDTHLRAAQRIAKLGSWEFDLQTQEITWSEEVFRIFDRDPAQGVPTYEELLQIYHPDDRAHHDQVVQTGIATGMPYDLAARLYRPDGSLGYIQARGEPFFDELGRLSYLVGTILDITDLKQAEAKLLQATAQLEASNRELEAFAYSVSHDLRAPLRAIDGFSKALLEDYGDKIDAEGQDYFDRIRKNVSRMGLLIDDLLSLSRVTRSEVKYTLVDLSALAQEVIQDLRSTDPDRAVDFVAPPQAVVVADAALMRVALTNLLHNAWKFTSHHAIARIELGVMSCDGERVYFVRDDGAGFDMAYAKMLFGVFQRLHNTQEFPGTGIGLATVQRVIHRHGGRIWAEGAVEQGATFYFTLPQQIQTAS